MLFGKKKKTEPVPAPAPAPAPSKEIYEFIAKSQDEKTNKALVKYQNDAQRVQVRRRSGR